MRIRKKTPKPSAKRPPLYFIGYRGTAPSTDELKVWYEREYGGPLVIHHETGSPESWQASHGPWSAHAVMPLPADQVADVMKQLDWEHELMGAIAPSLAAPREMPDTVLFAARLARGLTFLTQGTAYDVTTRGYLNPSDWQDRPLTAFILDDHVATTHWAACDELAQAGPRVQVERDRIYVRDRDRWTSAGVTASTLST